MNAIRGAFGAADYSNAGGYKAVTARRDGHSFAEASMSPIDRFFIWTDRFSDLALAGGVAGAVAGFWIAFAVGAYLVLR